MKTFKVVNFQVHEGEQLKDIKLIDALIINKEDGRRTWLIEIFISDEYFNYFRELEQKKTPFDVQVTISHLDNDPALSSTRILGIQQTDNRISVLMEGQLKQRRNDYAEQLLSFLIQNGKQGEELLQMFKSELKKKQTPANSKKG